VASDDAAAAGRPYSNRRVFVDKIFGSDSTTDEVLDGVDLGGRRVLVTGVSAGLGIETARALTARGAEVVGAARDLGKARVATAHIPGLALEELDLASLISVRACADRLIAAGRPFDVIIANAGVMACPKGTTADGFETQFGTNHLGHFLLINRIASLLKPGGRLVNLSSAGHRYSDVALDDPNFARTEYEPLVAYGRSKTANILFAVEFDRRHRDAGIRATAVHPGIIKTELDRHMSEETLRQLISSLNASRPAGAPEVRYKTVPEGAATTVWSGFVAAADSVGGRYCEDCHVADLARAPGVREGVQPYALDPETAKALWAKSEQMVGERFS
jgi:NAD(P)-dependent dehydrogenase (short-subunit alcohol dehydrogenase family)